MPPKADRYATPYSAASLTRRAARDAGGKARPLLSHGMQTAPLQISMVTVVKRFIAFYGIICANLNSEIF